MFPVGRDVAADSCNEEHRFLLATYTVATMIKGKLYVALVNCQQEIRLISCALPDLWFGGKDHGTFEVLAFAIMDVCLSDS